MVHRVMAWLRRCLLNVGLAAVRTSGLKPGSRVVLLVLVSGERLCHVNVRDTAIVDGWLLIEDAYGRIDRYRMETIQSVRHAREIPGSRTTELLTVGMVEGA